MRSDDYKSQLVCLLQKRTLKLLMAPCDLGPNDFIGFTEVKVCVVHESCGNYVKDRIFASDQALSVNDSLFGLAVYIFEPIFKACFQATSFGEDDFQG